MSAEFVDYLADQLRPLGPIRAKRMFGGYGIYLDGCMFAIVIDETLYLKTDAINLPLFEERDMPAFVYLRQGKPVSLSYRAVGAEAFEDTAELLKLCRLAFEAALRARR